MLPHPQYYSQTPPNPLNPRAVQPINLARDSKKCISNGYPQHRPNSSITSNPSQTSSITGSDTFTNADARHRSPETIASPSSTQPGFKPASTANIYDIETAVGQFSFDDYLTPEYSSENPFSENTTPHESFEDQKFSPDHVYTGLDDHNQSILLSHIPGTHPSGQIVHEPYKNGRSHSNGTTNVQLLSPRISTASSPPARPPRVISPQALDSRNMSNTPSGNAGLGQRRASASLQSDTATTTAPLPQGQSTLSPTNLRALSAHAISPIVTITSHSRGDSPARSHNSVSRGNSKRGRAADQDDATVTDRAASSSRLAIPSYFDTQTSDDDDDAVETRQGLAPQLRGNEEVKSSNDLEKDRELAETNSRVEGWLETSETGKIKKNDSLRPQQPRTRAYSTGSRSPYDQGPIPSKTVPGPGLILREDSGDELLDDDSDASIQYTPPPDTPPRDGSEIDLRKYFPPASEQDAEPLPGQFLRQRVWQDPVRAGNYPNTRDQPETANAAMAKFEQKAKEWDGRSKVATWGTGHHMNDLEFAPIVENSRATRHLSLSKRGRERGSSLLHKAKSILPRRSNSNLTQKHNEDHDLPNVEEQSRDKENAPLSPLQRLSSVSKQRSPASATGGAFAAMTGHLTAVGGGTGIPVSVEKEPPRSPLQKFRIGRSKSDAGRKDRDKQIRPGLFDMMRNAGGPPVSNLASPMHHREESTGNMQHTSDDDGNEEDDDGLDDGSLTMDLSFRLTNIIPTIAGFRNNALVLNPRIPAFLLDRIAQDQVRRYKKLVETKLKHTKSVIVQKKCSSGEHCYALHGEAALALASPKAGDPDASRAQFQITNVNEAKIDEANLPEGAVTPAAFPTGIPLPPVDRLPAEFECPLCFKVKKFQKPSDWTKHVHEDVQPFSCTYERCQEPKSFKRKADWVRHENERHRHLEWWKCNVADCSHVCFRKDNFVQHLVREHKKVEPKTKGHGPGNNKRPSSSWQDHDANEVWRLVDQCRFETPRRPQQEPCRFCGNICTTWKKLSVHMAKHMEQLSMQVLDLVKAREVSPDTIISPVEQSTQRPFTPPVVIPSSGPDHTIQSTLSPYGPTATPVYQNSSTVQSPAGIPNQVPTSHPYNQVFYSPQSMHQGLTGSQTPEDMYNASIMHSMPSNMEYPTAQTMSSPQQYMSSNQSYTGGMYISAAEFSQSQITPIHGQVIGSQAFDAGFDALNLGDMPTTGHGLPDITQDMIPDMYSSPIEPQSTYVHQHQFGPFPATAAQTMANQQQQSTQQQGMNNAQQVQGQVNLNMNVQTPYFYNQNYGNGSGSAHPRKPGGYDQY